MPILEKFHFPRFHDKNLKCTRFNPYSLFIYEDEHRLVDFFLILKEGHSQSSLFVPPPQNQGDSGDMR